MIKIIVLVFIVLPTLCAWASWGAGAYDRRRMDVREGAVTKREQAVAERELALPPDARVIAAYESALREFIRLARAGEMAVRYTSIDMDDDTVVSDWDWREFERSLNDA